MGTEVETTPEVLTDEEIVLSLIPELSRRATLLTSYSIRLRTGWMPNRCNTVLQGMVEKGILRRVEKELSFTDKKLMFYEKM